MQHSPKRRAESARAHATRRSGRALPRQSPTMLRLHRALARFLPIARDPRILRDLFRTLPCLLLRGRSPPREHTIALLPSPIAADESLAAPLSLPEIPFARRDSRTRDAFDPRPAASVQPRRSSSARYRGAAVSGWSE